MNMYILAIGILNQIFIGDSYTGPATPGGHAHPPPPPPPPHPLLNGGLF